VEFQTFSEWNEDVWRQAEPLYHQAFPEHGRKKAGVIRSMFNKKMCFLHLLRQNSDVLGMALTGHLQPVDALLIDYIAVREDLRHQGIGRTLLDCLKHWAADERKLDGIIIEIESEATPANADRYRFWTSCGFTITDYIQHYIWVPETYQAMYLSLRPGAHIPQDGRRLFRYITDFHKRAYTAGNILSP
jgi:GNAT superfamily N-acetyltransferase